MRKNKIAMIVTFGGLLIILLVIFIFTTGMSAFKPDGDKLALIEINGVITDSRETVRLIKKV